jgi:Lrp/AsnC family leucine-responsive transcriptional regulator
MVEPPVWVPDDADLRILAQMQRDASLSNQDLARLVHLSPATCLRRVKRMNDLGVIERQVALLSPKLLGQALGQGLQALVEVTLDVQATERLDAFEARAVAEPAVQQVWRVSPGPDFVLVVCVPNMDAYQALTKRLFSEDANVRQVRAFFAVKRAKFGAELPLEPRR